MRVRLRDEGRIFTGTAKQIVQSIKQTAAFANYLSLDEYIAWCSENATTVGITVVTAGSTVEERCAELIEQMVASGFAERFD